MAPVCNQLFCSIFGARRAGASMFVRTVGILQRRDVVDAKRSGTVQEIAKLLIGEQLTNTNVLLWKF